jgi:hypothetical protein
MALALALIAAAPISIASAAPTRYSLAGGCYGLRSAATGEAVAGAQRLRMQGTAPLPRRRWPARRPTGG